MRYNYYGFPEYVPVAKRRANAARKLKELQKKRPGIQPVVIEGSAIARTWWGKSWNQNLERYADYSNRIGRGRSYVRNGAVLDLQIQPGKISALVQGSQSKPYEITISIQALDKNTWQRVRQTAQGQLDSLSELIEGKFPKALQEAFFDKTNGLFPSPKEIDFDCSCPDSASMCKHVAATLYGVGARLDNAPSLFFDLRKIDMKDLISQAVKSTSQALLKKSARKSARVIEEASISDVFGIKLDDAVESTPKKRAGKSREIPKSEGDAVDIKPAKRTRRTTARVETPAQTPAQSPAKKTKKAPARAGAKNPPKLRVHSAASPTGSILETVLAAIPTGRKTAGIADICTQSGLGEKQVRNALARATAQGIIKTPKRGAYTKA